MKELHVFSHSIGGGLFLGYGDAVLGNARSMLADSARGGRAFYDSVLNAEKGTLFADDLVRSPYAGYAARMRSLFVPGGKQIKQKGTWNKVPLDGKIAVAGKRRFVGERDVLRLAPDVGTYREYKP